LTSTSPPTTLEETLNLLTRHGDEGVRTSGSRKGSPYAQFGVKMGDIRAIAKAIKSNHELGLQLWASNNLDAMLLATLVMKPKSMAQDDLEQMVSSVANTWLADWLMTNVVRQYPCKEELRRRWMQSADPMLARAGWSLTTERVLKTAEGLDLADLLDRIECEMAGAPEPAQWTMNYCLAEIGINFPEHRQRAIDIGEKLGIYRDYPVSKGCTSPYAPIWIAEMVSRKT